MISLRDRVRPSPAQVLLAVSMGFALLLGVYDLAVYRPGARQLRSIQSETASVEKGLDLAEQLAREHPEVLRRVRANTGDGSRPGLSNPAVELLTGTARRHGLDLDRIEPGPVETVGLRVTTPIALALSGHYDDFVEWVREVEGSEVLVTVDRIWLEGSPTGEHLFSVNLSTYAFSVKE